MKNEKKLLVQIGVDGEQIRNTVRVDKKNVMFDVTHFCPKSQ